MMSSGVIMGQYYPVQSPVHAMDPRAKILLAVIFMVVLFLGNNFWAFLIMGGFAALAIGLSKVPVKMLVRGLRPIAFILIFTMGLHLFLTPGPEIFRIGPIAGTWSGLVQGLFIGVRLIILIMFTSLLTLTTSPIELTDGLEDLLKPFQKIGVPAHELAMMMTIALRFIPTLLDETDRIMKAQLARGASFDRGGLWKRLKAFLPVLIPLFVIVFQRAEDLAVAMEARCYRGGAGRTRMSPLAWKGTDTAALLLVPAVVILLVTIDRSLA